MSRIKRKFYTAVVKTQDQAQRAVDKMFHKVAGVESILLLYNIGDELDATKLNVPSLPLNYYIHVYNNDCDLVTKKPYGEDYLTATQDAGIIGQQLGGTQAGVKHWQYNFFSRKKYDILSVYPMSY